MGQGQSELKASLDRLASLRNKPELLKAELSQLVEVCPVDEPLPVKLDKKVFDIIHELLTQELTHDDAASPFDLMTIFQALQRFVKIRVFYTQLARADLMPYVTAIKKSDPIALVSVLNAVAWMLDCRVVPEHGKEKEWDVAKEESAVKYAFFEYKGYDALCLVLVKYARSEHTNIVAKVLDILSLSLADHIATSRFHIVQRVIKLLTPHSALLLELTIHEQLTVRCFSIIFLSGFLLQSPYSLVQALQEQVLRSGYLLWYVMFSIDASGINADNAYYHFYDKSQTLLARKLLSLLCSGHAQNRDTVLSVIPLQLQGAIDDPVESRVKLSGVKANEKQAVTTALWYQFQSGAVQRVNCEHLFNNLDDDIKLPHVVWVGRMKAELLDQIRQEIENFQIARHIYSQAAWEAESFEVSHDAYLNKYCRVGNFFVSILIPALQNRSSGYVLKPELMQQLLSALFQRAVIEDDPSWKLACMGAISTMYERYPEHFRELLIIPYYVYLLQPQRAEPIWRDHIIRFMQTVLREPINAKRFLTFGGLAPLIHMVGLIHTLEAPNDVGLTVSVNSTGESMPELNRGMSLASPKAVNAAQAAAAAATQAAEAIDEENDDASEDDEQAAGAAAVRGRGTARAADSDSDEADEQLAAPRSKGTRGELSYSPSPDVNAMMSSSDDDSNALSPPAHPPAPPAPSPPPPPPPPPQPAAAAVQNNGPAREAPTTATTSTSSSSLSATSPAARFAAFGRRNSAPEKTSGGTLQSTSGSKPPRGAVSIAAASSSSSSNAASAAGGGAPSASASGSVDSEKPTLVTQAGGVRMKSAAESKWDWSDEKENLMSGLPPIFPVEEVAARCIRLLRIIAYGGPKLRRQLTTPGLLQCLSTLLLCPVAETREDGLRLYLDLLSSSPHQIPFLVKTGLFPFIVYSFRFGISPLLAKLIDRTHLRQTPEIVPEGSSSLAPFLPPTLTAILVTEGAEGLRMAMEADTVQPEMIWNGALRLHMNDAIQKQLAPFLAAIRQTPDTPFPSSLLKIAITYDSLQDELSLGGVYLHPLNQIGETDLQAVVLKDPARFVAELQKALISRKYSGDDLGAVLLACTIAVSRYPSLDDCRHFKAFPVLLALLDPSDKSSPSIAGRQSPEFVLPLMSKAAQLLNALLILDGPNCQLCFDAKGLDRIAHCIAACTQADLTDETTLIATHHALASFAELVKRYPPALKQLEADPATVSSIIHYTKPQLAAQYPQPCMGALGCMTALARSDRLLDTVIRQGGLLQAVRIAVLYGAEDAEQAADEAEQEINRLVRQSAAAMLLAVRERGNKKVQAVLTALVTLDGLQLLARPTEFLHYLDDTLDDTFKQRLTAYIHDQLQAIQEADGEDWREFSDGTISFS